MASALEAAAFPVWAAAIVALIELAPPPPPRELAPPMAANADVAQKQASANPKAKIDILCLSMTSPMIAIEGCILGQVATDSNWATANGHVSRGRLTALY